MLEATMINCVKSSHSMKIRAGKIRQCDRDAEHRHQVIPYSRLNIDAKMAFHSVRIMNQYCKFNGKPHSPTVEEVRWY